jgi:hypothetical protein
MICALVNDIPFFQIAKESGMVTVRWKHSPSEKEWFGVSGLSGPSSQGFVVLNRPPNALLKKLAITPKFPVLNPELFDSVS